MSSSVARLRIYRYSLNSTLNAVNVRVIVLLSPPMFIATVGVSSLGGASFGFRCATQGAGI